MSGDEVNRVLGRWSVPRSSCTIVAALALAATMFVTSPAVADTQGTTTTTAATQTSGSSAGSVQPLSTRNLLPFGYTMLAALRHPAFAYSWPGHITKRVISPLYQGSPVEMPVITVQSGYLLIRLPTRPNESTTWVKKSDATVSATPYRIQIFLHSMHMRLLYKGLKVFNAPVGIGTPADPTPIGRFFITFYAAPPNLGYGPFVMVTSAHSNKITDWEQSGDAMVAIHGPLGAGSLIGTTGARISHGCIRMHVYDQRHIGNLPIGTPVQIIK